MYMGRKYIINIKNTSDDEKILLMDDSDIFIYEYNESNIDLSVYLEIRNKNTDNLITLDEYFLKKLNLNL